MSLFAFLYAANRDPLVRGNHGKQRVSAAADLPEDSHHLDATSRHAPLIDAKPHVAAVGPVRRCRTGQLPSGAWTMKHTAAAGPETGSPTPSQEQRMAASRLRPTLARTRVLSALGNAKPSSLDANQIHRLLSKQFGSLRLGSIHRALNDLWMAGVLVRTVGERGRAFYAVKPDTPNAHCDTLRCHCGAQLAFIEDSVLRERLQSLASEEGFTLEAEPVFAITTTCAKCR